MKANCKSLKQYNGHRIKSRRSVSPIYNQIMAQFDLKLLYEYTETIKKHL